MRYSPQSFRGNKSSNSKYPPQGSVGADGVISPLVMEFETLGIMEFETLGIMEFE